ncbi:MAG: zinc-ribbon domain-containing protein [Myxococcota bacterium]
MGSVALILMVIYIVFILAMGVKLVRDWSSLKGRELLADLDDEAKKIEELAAAKARLLRDIKELEFDHQMGHLSDKDYTQLRKRLERKTIRIMKKLDTIHGDADYGATIDHGLGERFGIYFDDHAAEDAAEAASPPAKPEADGVDEASHKVAPPEEDGEKRQICPGCGWSMDAEASFCSQCGTALSRDCGACGAKLSLDAQFCEQCGTPVVVEVGIKSAAAAAEERGS